MSALQIEGGKFYRSRDGRKIGPMFRYETTFSELWKSRGEQQSGYWHPDGSWDRFQNPKDLVAEWPDEPAPAEPDLHAQILDAERRCEAAGLRVPEGKGHDFPVLFGVLNDWITAKAGQSDPDFDEVPAASPEPDPYYATILVPAAKVESLSLALSDLACWARGFRAALPRNEFGVPSEDAPMGTWAVTEINIALKRALEKTA